MKTILSLGRLHPLKGLDLLISAWAEVVRSSLVHYCEPASLGATPRQVSALVGEAEGSGKITNELMNSRTNALPLWQLVIAGPDEQGTLGKLKGISEKLKLTWREEGQEGAGEADIVFMGPVHGEAKWALMKHADIFVLPSRSENFGIVVGEALACGVPVVTTAVGPWGERGGEVLKFESSKVLKFVNTNRGLFVVETSVEGIAEGLQRMMALSDAERHEMGQSGAEWVTREMSWEAVAKKMVAAYEK